MSTTATTAAPKAAGSKGGKSYDVATLSKPIVAAGFGPAQNSVDQDRMKKRLELVDELVAHGPGMPVEKFANPQYTADVAIAQGLPLRDFRLAELKVHRYNPRPESGDADLTKLIQELRSEGQHDPIHVIPDKDGGFAVMEGQRRLLAAKDAGLTTLKGWIHPIPDDLFEIYAFGQKIHESRKDTTAYDLARVWGRLLEDGVVKNASDLGRRTGNGPDRVSKVLSILKLPSAVLELIRSHVYSFSERHLAALAQIQVHGGDEKALECARSVVDAPEKSPVSARQLEAIEKILKDGRQVPDEASKRGRRPNSVPHRVRSSDGREFGNIKAFLDGRLEYKPARALSEELAEHLAEKLKTMLVAEMDAYYESHPNERPIV